MALKFDFIVVGAGTAGCLIANRLSANGKYSVADFYFQILIGYSYRLKFSS